MLSISSQSVILGFSANASINSQPASEELTLSVENSKRANTSLGQTQAANPLSSHESNRSQTNSSNIADLQNIDVSELTDEQAQQLKEIEQVVSQLKARDREVRVHEQAHVAAGGQYVTSGPIYQYQTGPDGNKYAVGGEVGIDTSPISGDPQATLQKAIQIQAAALAPAEPSAQDRKVASAAAQMASQARAEIVEQGQQALSDDGSESEESEGVGRSGDNEGSSTSLIRPSSESDENPQLVALNQERNQFESRLIAQSA